jgi:hypothetical protein
MHKIGFVLSAAIVLGACKEANTQRVKDFHPRPSVPVKEIVLDNLKSPWSIAFINDTDALIYHHRVPR